MNDRRKLLGAGLCAGVGPLVLRCDTAFAQQRFGHAGKLHRLGIFQPGAPPDPLLDALREGLRDLGYVEGRDIVFEIRWAEGRRDQLDLLAAELVAAKVDVISTLSTPLAIAARRRPPDRMF